MPTHSEEFYHAFNSGKYSKCIDIIQNIETPLFNTFMKVGWHASMRAALKNEGYIFEDRKPFITLPSKQIEQVIIALNKII